MPRDRMAGLIFAACLIAAGCRSNSAAEGSGGPAADTLDQTPVALNGGAPVHYPPALLKQRVEGRVMLQLLIDSTGAVVTDSTRVAESSGTPALDSAALAAAPNLRYAPALRHGRPVRALFLQPIYFHPTDSDSTADPAE